MNGCIRDRKHLMVMMMLKTTKLGYRAEDDRGKSSKRCSYILTFEKTKSLCLISENASTVRPEFVSDEENTIADVANDSMDIDSLDRKSVFTLLVLYRIKLAGHNF